MSHARSFAILASVVLLAATFSGAAPASSAVQTSPQAHAVGKDRYHNGVFGQAAKKYCKSTSTYTPSHKIRTKIVRSTDKWSNTISSRYRKFTKCTAYQMTSTVWCTTRLVDGYSKMCISSRPKAGGSSPCRKPRLDVRGVYHPKSGVLEITCINKYRSG